MSFQDEFDKRCRRVLGIIDDLVEIRIREDKEEGYWDGYCETCAFWNEGETFATIEAYDDNGLGGMKLIASKKFDDLGEIMRALDAVEL